MTSTSDLSTNTTTGSNVKSSNDDTGINDYDDDVTQSQNAASVCIDTMTEPETDSETSASGTTATINYKDGDATTSSCDTTTTTTAIGTTGTTGSTTTSSTVANDNAVPTTSLGTSSDHPSPSDHPSSSTSTSSGKDAMTTSADVQAIPPSTSSPSNSSSSFLSTLTNGFQRTTTTLPASSPTNNNNSTNSNRTNPSPTSSFTISRSKNKKSPHHLFIETILLPIIYKLQKEVGWRRYKDCQAPLQEVVLALKLFQNETWPPVQQQPAAAAIRVENEDKPTATTRNGSTESPIHDAMMKTMNVLIQILNDDYSMHNMNKYPRPIELSLEAITLIIAQHRYISGSTVSVSSLLNNNNNNNNDSLKNRTNSMDSTTMSMMAAASTKTSTTEGGASHHDGEGNSTGKPAAAPSTLLLIRLIESVCKMSESTNEAIQFAVCNTITTIMTCTKLNIHDSYMLLTIKCIFHIYLVCKSNNTIKKCTKRSLLDIMKVIFFRMEAYDALYRNSNDGTTAAGSVSDNTTISTTTTVATLSSPVGNNSSSVIRAVSSEDSIDHYNNNITLNAMKHFPTSSTGNNFLSQYHADAYYLFRSLCKLSSKELPADLSDLEQQKLVKPGRIILNAINSMNQSYTDPTELNSKLLALELILVALEQYVGEAFFVVVPPPPSNSSTEGTTTNQPKFIYLVQHYLCGSLLKNCISNHTQVAYLSQKIFFVLVYKFKGHLKQDIEVFISNVFFRVLESQNSSFKQKALVLVSLRSICQDPNLLTQIFLNYDCDFDSMNLYKDIVHMLTKVGGKATSLPSLMMSSTKKDIEQEFELSLGAMECLVTILKAFLRALNLSSGSSADDANNSVDIDSAGARIRTMLQLDSALASIHLQPEDSTTSFGTSIISKDSDTDDTDKVLDQPPNSLVGRSSFQNESTSMANDHLDNTLSTPTSSSSQQQDITVFDGMTDTTTFAQSSTTPATGMTSILESDVTNKIVDAFDRKRIAEQNFQSGIVKFTLSLKGGLQYFIDHGFVTCDAKEIALFFIAHKDKLDKTQVGEALGREPDAAFGKDKTIEADKGGPGFWMRILHHYTNALDFHNCLFDEGIRLFLSGFRLPGEAQKIDRIMEKFAERYTSQNPDVFPSSDTAFILGFSVIMLNTDLHNPSIKPEKRMTVDSFLRNNRGIGENGSNLPDDLLRGIFDRIKERPFSLKEDDAARERVGAQKNNIFDTTAFFEGPNSIFGISAEDRKRENFKKERDEMVAVTEQLIRRRPGKSNNSVSSVPENEISTFNDDIPPAEVVKPMFDVTWGPMLGILSQVLECADDDRSVAVCLNGFVFAIRLAAHSQMTLVRDTFVSSLAKFTFLGSIKEMKRKNVESIRTLLSVAVIDGEYLGESWLPVLQCMSQLARLRLSASGLDSDDSFLMVEVSKTSSGSVKVDTSNSKTEETNGKAVLEAVHEILIDKVFSSTINLSANSLAHFVQQLIAVSSAEIDGNSKGIIAGIESSKTSMDSSRNGSGLSIFSLQRLIDVADYNMDIRPRLVWSQVWEMMAEYLVRVARHANRMVSIFAIDSLKQLSLKFLEKPELSEFNFQCSFLKPFLIVMEDKKTRDDIRELILQCIDNIIRAKSRNLRSGWKVMFSILTISASDPVEKNEYLALSILQRVLDEHLGDIFDDDEVRRCETNSSEVSSLEKRNRNSNAEDFVSLCKASLSFIQTGETDSLRPYGLSMRAFCHIAIYADLVGSQRVLPPTSVPHGYNPTSTSDACRSLSEKERLGLVLWQPMFDGLANCIRSTAKTSASGVGCLIQRGGVLALRSILLRHGHLLTTPQLRVLLEDTIIPPIQHAAENDTSHVALLISESPSISAIDFLVPPPPLPPDHEDSSLQQFSALNDVPKRVIGPAELLLEASFTDLRHGGDGDLRRAYLLAQKSADDGHTMEQAFPDSWIATTASLSMGLLTDVVSEIIVHRQDAAKDLLWPLIASQYMRWLVGRVEQSDEDESSDSTSSWFPCEALVRIASHDLLRLPKRMFSSVQFCGLPKEEKLSWVSLFMKLYSDVLLENSRIEKVAQHHLLGLKKELQLDSDDSCVETPFGIGRVVSVRNDLYTDTSSGLTKVIPVSAIDLDFGAILFQPVTNPVSHSYHADTTKDIPEEVNVPEAYWVQVVPTLKIRAVTAFCVQHSICATIDDFAPLASRKDVTLLVAALKESQLLASSASTDDDVSMAFQDALLKDWGDGIQIPSDDIESMSRLSLQYGSATYFLTQESSAAKTLLHMLATLFLQDFSESSNDWDRKDFAESTLVTTMTDILVKFLDSMKKDGHLIDYSIWRKVGDNLNKIALYGTSFAFVVIDILQTIRSMRHEDFDRYREKFFPLLCSLVCMDSGEMRQLVHEILTIHVGPYLGMKNDVRHSSNLRI